MRLRPAHLPTALAAALVFGALPTAATAAAPVPAAQAVRATTTSSASSASATLEVLRRIAPLDLAARAERLLAARGVHLTDTTSFNALDPADYQCGPTAFTNWADKTLDFTDDEAAILDLAGAGFMPVMESILFGDVEGTDSYGVRGQYTKQITQAWKKLRVFWDEDSTEVEVTPMHGQIMADSQRLARVYVALGMPHAEAAELAGTLASYFDTPRFDHGDHPYFTLNAFATRGGDRGDQIIMGDGFLQMFGDLGMGAVAPQVILAHENIHQLQFDLGVFDEVVFADPAEATRRTELQADAGAAYSVSHPRGLSMQWNRVRHVLPVFHTIGDCSFENASHHGTPNQRLAAGDFGYRVQENARPRGHVIPGATFLARVDAQLPVLVAPDAR